MRLLLAWIALLGAACVPSPEPASPAVPARAALPGGAPPAASAAPPADAPPADQGTPGEPLMAVRWTFHMPSAFGRPWSTQRLAVTEGGDATWTREEGGGDGDVNEDLSPRSSGPGVKAPLECCGHLAPDLHRKLAAAARRAMASGCKEKAPPIDEATTALSVIREGENKSCSLGRTGGSYAAFEQARTEVVDVLCQRR